MNNIILIGMPGSGKSTVGVLVAKMLGMNFLDSDLIIQQTTGKKLFEILRDEGTEQFKRIEDSVNANLQAQNTVIATGGSAVYGARAMEHLSKIGTVVYLKVSLAELKRRVDNLETRGIVMEEGQTLDDVFAERGPLYEKYAHITVTCTRGSLRKNAEKLAAAVKQMDEKR